MFDFCLDNNKHFVFSGESSAGVSDRVLSQLLTELDGIQVKYIDIIWPQSAKFNQNLPQP